MSKTLLSVEGVDDIKKMLSDLAPREARNLMRATIHGVASEIAKDARRSAPRGASKNLSKAVKAKRKKSHPDRPVSEVRVEHGRGAKHDAWYWWFVERGTKNVNYPRQEYLGPSIEAAKKDMDSRIRSQVGKKLEQLLARKAKRRSM